VVKEVLVQLGSKVSEGAVLIKVETGARLPRPLAAGRRPGAAAAGRCAAPPRLPLRPAAQRPGVCPAAAPPRPCKLGGKVHASPSVRAYARELGVDLSKVKATGPKGRIVKEDLTKPTSRA
jgi:pyruvate dehydrogenase E2 component (dihydrolipoamide acetyltransferase)